LKKKQRPRQVTIWNGLLFFFEAMGFEVFGIITANLYGVSQLTLAGELLLIAFLGFLVLEVGIVYKLDSENPKPFLTPLLLTHLPWLMSPALRVLPHFHLPFPHDFLLRKFQIFFGLMWISHLFLFSGWTLWRTKRSTGVVSKRFAGIAVFFFVGVTLFTVQCEPTGDEPHYLLMDYSLIHDGDLNLSNNYQNKDYEKFYHRGLLEPQALEHVIDGRRYSHHPIGPVLLVLPSFWLLGRLGASLTMALLAALALYLTLHVMELTGAKGWPLQVVGPIGLFSSPLLLFSGLIYPEIPTACLVALSLYLFLKKRWLWLGVAQGLMLWMHNRNVLLVIPFFLITFYEAWKTKEKMEAVGKVAIGFILPAAALALYFYSIYGVFTPLGAHNESFKSLFPLSHFWKGFFGLLLDQECGLWFHFPIFALMITGGILLFRSKSPLKLPVLGVFIFFYLSMSFYENLGLTPATRYMVGVTPLLLLMLYPALEQLKKWDIWAILTAVSLAAGALVNWLLAVIPWMRYNKLDGQNWILKIAGFYLHQDFTSLEPAFNPQVVEMKSYVISAVWVGVTVLLSVLFLKTESQNPRKG
jgi:hypothetical protein